MGFMSGLAEGFGKQVTAGLERKGQKERDALNIAMERWNKRKTEYETQATTDRKLQEQAKAIASSNGLPEGAWVDIYQQRLLVGDTMTGAEKWATAQNWSVEDQQPSMPETPAAPEAPTAQDTEMADSGLAPGQAESAGQQDPGILGSMAGAVGNVLGTMGNPQAQQDALMQGANERATSTLGITPEEQAKIDAGYKPNVPASNMAFTPKPDAGSLDPNDAVWLEVAGKWKQGYVSPNGATDLQGQPLDGVTKVWTNEQFTQVRNVLGSIPKAEELMTQKADTVTLVENVAVMSQMADENPNVLARAVGLSVGINEIGNELNSIFSQINTLTEEEQALEESQYTQKLSDAMVAEGANASDAQRYAALAIGVKFDLARAMSGPGPLSEADRQAGEQALSTNDPAIFLQIAQDLAKKSLRSTDALANQLSGSPQVKQAMSIDGVDLGNLFEPVAKSLSIEATDWLGQNAPAPGTALSQPGANPPVAAEPQGEVLEAGQVTSDMVNEFPDIFTIEDVGKNYRRFPNGFDVEE